MKRNKAITNVLLGAGAYLLESLRERWSERADEWRERARDTYEVASQRTSRASAALRGDDGNILSHATALLLGLGVGVGVGMLLAPASGEETRRNIAGKVQDLGQKVRSQAPEFEASTGTYGQ